MYFTILWHSNIQKRTFHTVTSSNVTLPLFWQFHIVTCSIRSGIASFHVKFWPHFESILRMMLKRWVQDGLPDWQTPILKRARKTDKSGCELRCWWVDYHQVCSKKVMFLHGLCPTCSYAGHYKFCIWKFMS